MPHDYGHPCPLEAKWRRPHPCPEFGPIDNWRAKGRCPNLLECRSLAEPVQRSLSLEDPRMERERVE